MSDVEHKTVLENTIDNGMKLACQNIDNIVKEWDTEMCAEDVDKFHHLVEIIYYSKAIKHMHAAASK